MEPDVEQEAAETTRVAAEPGIVDSPLAAFLAGGRAFASLGAWSGLGPLSLLLLLLAAGGCATATALPPVDLSRPGWNVREIPALWRPQRGAPELAGELLVAVNGGDRVIQFSKQGLPVVTAVVMSNRWQVTSALRAGTFGGRLPAPTRLPWFAVDGSPPRGLIPAPWTLHESGTDAGWTLVNPRTGESIDVGSP